MSNVREVHADLVGAPGEQLKLEQREPVKGLPHKESRLRGLALALGADGKAHGVIRVPSQRLVDEP